MIRRATADDAAIMAQLRDEMATEMRPDDPHDPTFRERLRQYWAEMLPDERVIAWLAEEEGAVVGMTALLLHHHPPRPFGERRRGYVTSVYVVPAYRRRGIGQALMEAAQEYGREHGLQRLELRTSEQGRSLYAALGFEPKEVLMLSLEEGSRR